MNGNGDLCIYSRSRRISSVHLKTAMLGLCCDAYLGIATKSGHMHLVTRLWHPLLLLLLLDGLIPLQCMPKQFKAAAQILTMMTG